MLKFIKIIFTKKSDHQKMAGDLLKLSVVAGERNFTVLTGTLRQIAKEILEAE